MNTNMTGFKVKSKICVLMLWTKVASALKELNLSLCLHHEDPAHDERVCIIVLASRASWGLFGHPNP